MTSSIQVSEEMRDRAREKTMRAMHLHDGGDSSRAFDAGWDAALAAKESLPQGDEVEQAARAFEAEALAVASEREGEGVYLQPGLDEMDPEMREAFYRCIGAAITAIGSQSIEGEREIVREKCPYVLPEAMRGMQCPNCDCAEGKSGTLPLAKDEERHG